MNRIAEDARKRKERSASQSERNEDLFDFEKDSDQMTKMPKPAKKQKVIAKTNRHNYQAWSSVLKTEQERNKRRIEEVHRKYKD